MIDKQHFMDKQSISHDIATYIKQQILNGKLNPGDRIVEIKMARELGLSQTPVREAIRQLSGEGIITIVPNKGPIVRAMEKEDVLEIYSLRAVTEGFAIRLATQKATGEDIAALEDFYENMKRKLSDHSILSLLADSLHIHQTIMKLADHSRLSRTYESISFQISMVNRILGTESTKQKEVDQHLELIEALISRDPEQAEKTMRKHIYRSYQEFIGLNEDLQPEFGEFMWF
jgi:DNA-binding GntR family transcriptional regulator